MTERFPISWKKFSRFILVGIAYFFVCIVFVCVKPANFVLGQTVLTAETIVTNDPPVYGPFNGIFLPGGNGLKKTMVKDDSVLRADSPWSMYAWVKTEEPIAARTLVAGMGDPEEEYSRYLAVDGSHVMLWMGKDNSLSAPVTLSAREWHLLAATFDGQSFHVYSDGTEVADGKADLGSASGILQMAPAVYPTAEWKHFGGKIAAFTLRRNVLSAEEVKKIAAAPPKFVIIAFEEGSKPWWVQERGQAGYRAPQDPETMPRSKVAPSKPAAVPVKESREALEASGENSWTIAGGWKMNPAPNVKEDGVTISQSGFKNKDWYVATVPGTVLTTLVDRGVYPDPDYGLNNLAIPESLNKQDYWYRTEFKAPKLGIGRRLTLTFEGINYHATVWMNGKSLGGITGAFIRGIFDVTDVVNPGTNVLAVQVSPPPHPGIPHEQSIKGGPGENGGLMCLDGPTFVATEGWDWVPGIRDRDTGIWQPVTLTTTSVVKIGDPQVVTTLPLPDTSRADVEITVPLENLSEGTVKGTVSASFDGVSVTKEVTVTRGKSSVTLAPAEFKQLTVEHPRLWWPNGYGKQDLHTAKVSFAEGGTESDTKQVRFGIREITYELSLFDGAGHLRRVEYSPADARARKENPVDVSHQGMREIPAVDPFPSFYPPEWKEGWKSWVASLAPGGERAASVKTLQDEKAAPYLVIKVNGVRIACRGGNWGMDDARKRVSRAKLEPYFRLHHDANVNIIRNWVGQSTEEVFYDLADEYGLLVWNDFWDSTQNYNIEAQDPALFLENARDTIERFRNHPSIAMWCGRNEGVPQPIINDGLTDLVRTLDGTRYYSPSSNQVNLQNSGPYKYMDPKLYYTTLNHGFSVETGTPSFSTLESFEAWIPKEDWWPISDDWAYHDWHQAGNGDMAPFMAEMQAEFGAPTSLEDFERKAQMLDYIDHRAIFEGMNAHLWAPNSGRMLWMTQPAWPSNVWQILSSDYDTQASFYGVKKACEPVHVQLDLSNYAVQVVNTTTAAMTGLMVRADVYSLENKSLLHREEKKDAAADGVAEAFVLDLGPLMGDGVVLVKLELRDSAGVVVSENLYWLGASSAAYRKLGRLGAATVTATARAEKGRVVLSLKNTGNVAAIETKLTLLLADGTRVLPAYYSDNYVSLLPGETREVVVEYPAGVGAAQVRVRGWNLVSTMIAVR
jgi:Exo-beta-D-glucosaminidase Ig-fold domain/Glycosyl hydrolases family 2/Concanavalin A-like lectin/glucanases superfamily/Glycosyl hydrolases family 2, sugar binding domain/Glycosyl hydrolases family 2, TIM barrel domain